MKNATDTGLFGEKLPNYIDAHMEKGEVKVYHTRFAPKTVMPAKLESAPKGGR